jgi:hypothetical protein
VKKLLAVIFITATTVAASAQSKPEYKMEIGAGAGLVGYVGDYNGNPLKDMQPWMTAIAKYRLDPRVAIGFDLGTGKLKGQADTDAYEFSHSVTEADIRLEYNFWPFGTGQEYRGARRFTPFITAGLGATRYGGQENGATMNLPIGAGVKYKIGERLNLTAEWAIRFTLSDKLDGRKDPRGIKSSGVFKNTDGYSILQIALTYDLMEKCRTCHRE